MNSSSIVEYWSLLPLAVCPSLECFPFFQPCFPSSSLSTLVSQLSHLISSRSSPSKSQTHPQTVFGWNCPASRWRLERSVSQSTCISTHVQGLNTSCRLFRQILDRYATRRLLPPTPPGHRRLTDTTQLGAKNAWSNVPDILRQPYAPTPYGAGCFAGPSEMLYHRITPTIIVTIVNKKVTTSAASLGRLIFGSAPWSFDHWVDGKVRYRRRVL